MLKILALAASIALAATPATAADDAETVSAEVRIDDLNLVNPTDQQRLDRRLDSAARRVCRNGARGLTAITAENQCIALALQSAAPQAERAIALARSNQRLARIDMAFAG